MADPLHQFQVQPLPGLDFGEVVLPLVGKVHLAFTNSHLAMTIGFLLVVGFLTLVTNGAKVVPGRLQSVGETLFGMINGLTDSIIGHDGKKYFPFVFTVFTFILGMNLLGMFLSFTATSQLAVTATFGLITFILVVVIGIMKNGFGFLKLFWPTGAPLVMRPVVGLIEFFSFLLRPLTLTLRLFGNMMGGHIALKVFAGFVATAVIGAAGAWGFLIFPLAMGMTIGLTALEFLVAFLQAFVFAVLTCIYLNDVVNLGDGH